MTLTLPSRSATFDFRLMSQASGEDLYEDEADKLDPRITFTRAGPKDRTNEAGFPETVLADQPAFDFGVGNAPLGLILESTSPADVAEILSLKPWFSAQDGSFVVYSTQKGTSERTIMELSDNTLDNRITLKVAGGTVTLVAVVAGVVVATLTRSFAAGSPIRAAWTYGPPGYALAVNGSEATTAAGAVPVVNRLSLGRSVTGAEYGMWLERVSYQQFRWDANMLPYHAGAGSAQWTPVPISPSGSVEATAVGPTGGATITLFGGDWPNAWITAPTAVTSEPSWNANHYRLDCTQHGLSAKSIRVKTLVTDKPEGGQSGELKFGDFVGGAPSVNGKIKLAIGGGQFWLAAETA